MAKQLSITQIIKAITFAVSEVSRIGDLRRSNNREELNACASYLDSFPAERGPFPHGHYTSSRAAMLGIQKVAEARIASDPNLKGRIKFGKYYEALKVEIGVRCIRYREIVTERMVKEILLAAKNSCADQIVSASYYFPVFALEEETGPTEYRLGVVSFKQTAAFFLENRDEWNASIEQSLSEWKDDARSHGQDFDAEYHRSNFAEIERRFMEYRWLAVVRINGVEPDVGWEKAEYVIEQTFTLLRLFEPSSRDNFIGIATQSRNDRHYAQFMSPEPGRYHTLMSAWSCSFSTVVKGFFTDMRRVAGFRSLEVCMAQLEDVAKLSAAEQRMIAAMTWYGEAWKDRHAESRLVKFTICLEAILMTGGKEGITEQLAERMALFEDGLDAREKRYAEVREVYQARSKAVHGDTSRSVVNFSRLANTAEDLARIAILTFAELVPVLLRKSNLSKELNEFFTLLKFGGKKAAIDAIRRDT